MVPYGVLEDRKRYGNASITTPSDQCRGSVMPVTMGNSSTTIQHLWGRAEKRPGVEAIEVKGGRCSGQQTSVFGVRSKLDERENGVHAQDTQRPPEDGQADVSTDFHGR